MLGLAAAGCSWMLGRGAELDLQQHEVRFGISHRNTHLLQRADASEGASKGSGGSPQAAPCLRGRELAGVSGWWGNADTNLFRHWSDTKTRFHTDSFIFTFLHVCKTMFFVLGCAGGYTVPYIMELCKFLYMYIYTHIYSLAKFLLHFSVCQNGCFQQTRDKGTLTGFVLSFLISKTVLVFSSA